jgi:hypothetical protein
MSIKRFFIRFFAGFFPQQLESFSTKGKSPILKAASLTRPIRQATFLRLCDNFFLARCRSSQRNPRRKLRKIYLPHRSAKIGAGCLD